MPQPSQPPNNTPIAGQEYASPSWQQWVAQMHGAVTGRAFYVPTSAGAPSFTPEVRAGFVPMVYDTTNDALYVYNGGWVSVTLS